MHLYSYSVGIFLSQYHVNCRLKILHLEGYICNTVLSSKQYSLTPVCCSFHRSHKSSLGFHCLRSIPLCDPTHRGVVPENTCTYTYRLCGPHMSGTWERSDINFHWDTLTLALHNCKTSRPPFLPAVVCYLIVDNMAPAEGFNLRKQ